MENKVTSNDYELIITDRAKFGRLEIDNTMPDCAIVVAGEGCAIYRNGAEAIVKLLKEKFELK